jgi:hypothetical protein
MKSSAGGRKQTVGPVLGGISFGIGSRSRSLEFYGELNNDGADSL